MGRQETRRLSTYASTNPTVEAVLTVGMSRSIEVNTVPSRYRSPSVKCTDYLRCVQHLAGSANLHTATAQCTHMCHEWNDDDNGPLRENLHIIICKEELPRRSQVPRKARRKSPSVIRHDNCLELRSMGYQIKLSCLICLLAPAIIQFHHVHVSMLSTFLLPVYDSLQSEVVRQ